MIVNTDCWLTQNCRKYLSGKCNDDICMKQFKLNELYNNSLLPPTGRVRIALRPDADGTDRDSFITLKNIEENIEDFLQSGRNLYLWSCQCGNGKSAWATRMIQSYFEKIWYKSSLGCKALFISVPRYLIAIKNNISSADSYVNFIKNNIYDANLVVWDDIGTKCATQFEHDNLFNLIDGRFNLHKSNIFTSNISTNLLTEYVGERLSSRILGYSTAIEFKGQDKRGINK